MLGVKLSLFIQWTSSEGLPCGRHRIRYWRYSDGGDVYSPSLPTMQMQTCSGRYAVENTGSGRVDGNIITIRATSYASGTVII